jgi:hypothetical protein
VTVLATGTLSDGRRYQVLEELDTFCPLGLRFWDAVTDDQIRAGLRVRTWPEPALRPVVEAFRTRSDVYAFQGLPGLAALERPPANPTGLALVPPPAGSPPSPPPAHPFVLEVVDLERRFLPAAIRLNLPLPSRGVFLTRPPGSPAGSPPGSPAGSPPEAPPPGFYLFSSPTRPRGAGVAVVRGELVDAATGVPAAHALVRAAIPGQPDRFGLSDAAGGFALQFPLPPLPGGLGRLWESPDGAPSPPGPPVADRTWELALAVAWEPGILAPLPGTDLPDLARVLDQLPAEIVLAAGSPPAPPAAEWLGTLRYDGEVVARTAGDSRLLIVPAGSPP